MESINTINQQLNSALLNNFAFLGLDHIWSLSLLIMFAITLMILFSVSSYYLGRFLVTRSGEKVLQHSELIWLRIMRDKKSFERIALLFPGIVIYLYGSIIDLNSFEVLHDISYVLHIFASCYLILILNLILGSLLDSFTVIVKNISNSKIRPIKSYMQITKLCGYIISTILIISIILDKSPTYLLTGLGAMTAILLLVFKDSILGFVASIQLAVYDMVRIGDWIELPQYGANGDVIDISLNTVKVQNFDKTIVTIPSYALLTNGVVNWRGMIDSGGRRIKRSVHIDVTSVKFIDGELIRNLKKIELLQPVLQKQFPENEVEPFTFTNIGAFRRYLELYLEDHPKIHNNMTFIVRQLQETGNGVPIELYVFTRDTNWNRYESIQADIFDHIYAIAPYFELKFYQNISGHIA